MLQESDSVIYNMVNSTWIFSVQEEEAERSARWEQFLNTYSSLKVESVDNASEGDRKEDCYATEEEGSKRPEKWNEIRPCFYPIARALQHRFRKNKKIVQTNNGSITAQGQVYQPSSQRDSEEESDDEFYDVERSDMAQEAQSSADDFTDGSSELSDREEETCPWKEELDALVRGGVPMAMRGEVRFFHTCRYQHLDLCVEFTLDAWIWF